MRSDEWKVAKCKVESAKWKAESAECEVKNAKRKRRLKNLAVLFIVGLFSFYNFSKRAWKNLKYLGS